MACDILTGYTLGCRDNTGGVNTVYIAPFSYVDSTTKDADGKVTAITAGVSPSTIYKTYEQEAEVATFNQTVTGSVENGTVFYEQTVVLRFLKVNQTTNNLIKTLTHGNFSMLVKDENGVYHMIGEPDGNGARVTTGTLGVGKAMGDLNGAEVTFICKSKNPAPEVTSAAALAVIA